MIHSPLSVIVVKKLYSFVFRLILLFYSIFILLTYENILPDYIYGLAIVAHLSIYFYFFAGDGYMSKIRLIADYLLITLFLFQKDILIVSNFIYFSLPIINASNHSGRKINWKFLILISTLSFLFLIFISEKDSFTIIQELLMPIIVLVSISALIAKRAHNESKPMRQFAEIDNKLSRLVDFPRSYRLYKPLVENIQKLKYLFYEFNDYEDIVCLKLKKNGRWHLVNSSDFIYGYNIPFYSDLIENKNSTGKETFFHDVPVKLNGKEFKHSLILPIKSDETYIFLLPNNNSSYGVTNSLYLYELLNPILERFTRVIEFEQIYKNQNKAHINSLREKYFYIRNAEKAMHFIKNKLSPLDNIIEVLIEQLESEKGKIHIQDIKFKTFLKREITKSNKNLNYIVQRAKSILDKDKNPFNVAQLEHLKAYNIYAIVKEAVEDYLMDKETVNFEWEISEIKSKFVKFNKEGLHLLVNDWVSNMNKHGDGKKFAVRFIEDAEYYVVEFENSFPSSFTEDVKKLISDFNNDDRNEILRRKSHGIFQIKVSLEEMELKSAMQLKEKNIELKIKFKKYEFK